MKRSKMAVVIINEIMIDLRTRGLCFPKVNEAEIAFDLGENILTAIENAGMMPPIIENESFKIQADGQMTYAVHEWEPEDESN